MIRLGSHVNLRFCLKLVGLDMVCLIVFIESKELYLVEIRWKNWQQKNLLLFPFLCSVFFFLNVSKEDIWCSHLTK